MKFIRYGSLKPQYHDLSERSFHTAPVEYGIYAFPNGFKEEFLLGGVGSGSVENGRYRYLRDEKGKKIFDSPNNVYEYLNSHRKDKYGDDVWVRQPTEKYAELFRKLKINPNFVKRDFLKDEDNDDLSYDEIMNKSTYFLILNPPTVFNYTGNIWCHFREVCKRNEILKEVGSWILVDYRTYKKLLQKFIFNDKRKRCIIRTDDRSYCFINTTVNKETRMNPSGFPISYFDKDYYEVYIEKV